MPDSSYFLWEPPGHLTTVELSLDVVDKLNSLIRQTTVFVEADGTGRPLETGAILLGRRLDSGAITVDDFEEIPSEHRRGASFTLTVSDQTRLGHQLEKLAKEGSLAVGYFRIHTRPGLYLDHDDDLVIKQFFADSWQVVLLAKPQPGEPPEAGFFFWDEGDMDRRQTVLPFFLDRTALTASGNILETPEPTPTAVPRSIPAARRQNWIPVAGAIALVALAAVFIPAGVFSRSPSSTQPAAPVAMQAPAKDADSWPAPDELQKFNAAAARRARLASRTPSRPLSGTPTESAVGPAPGREEIAVNSLPIPPPSIPVSPRPKPRPSSTKAEVSLEPVHRSILRSTIGHIPLVGKLERNRKDDFIPARPRRARAPSVPFELSRNLYRDEPVVVRLRIAKNGSIAETELVSRKSNPVFAGIAVRAASEWAFEPARDGNKAVASDMLVHFRFRAPRQSPRNY